MYCRLIKIDSFRLNVKIFTKDLVQVKVAPPREGVLFVTSIIFCVLWSQCEKVVFRYNDPTIQNENKDYFGAQDKISSIQFPQNIGVIRYPESHVLDIFKKISAFYSVFISRTCVLHTHEVACVLFHQNSTTLIQVLKINIIKIGMLY